MTVLHDKDSQRLENVRHLAASDPVFWAMAKRPAEDLEQRTKDLDQIFTPARGFRVRAEDPVSTQVEVEAGVWVSGGTSVNLYAGTSVAVPAAAAGNIRIDLLWFNLDSGAVVRTAGTEQVAATTFPGLTKPDMPSNEGGVPLAYVYVDDVPADFDDQIAINTAGHIQDVRPAPGFHPFVFEDTVGNLNADTSGGAVGTSAQIARADHQHPLNVDANNPETLSFSSVAAPGSAGVYAQRDHVHALQVETVSGNLRTDIAGGAVGGSTNLVRADHRHPLNINDGTSPTTVVTSGGASPGVDNFYARRDHVHDLPASNPYASSSLQTHIASKQWDYNAGAGDGSDWDIVPGFTPSFVLFVGGLWDPTQPQGWLDWTFFWGVATGTGSSEQFGGGAAGDDFGHGSQNWYGAVSSGEVGGSNDTAGPGTGSSFADNYPSGDFDQVRLQCVAFGSTITIRPSNNCGGKARALVIGLA